MRTQKEDEKGVQIRPLWDPTGSVSVEVDDERRELVASARGERLEFALCEDRPERLGWVERRVDGGRVRRQPVAVSDVLCHCLRELDAEQQVLALSRRAARRALRRGGRWSGPARRLADQATAAPRRQRVSTLPFQVLFEHRTKAGQKRSLTSAVAAERIGYRMADGRADTERLAAPPRSRLPSRRPRRAKPAAALRPLRRAGSRSTGGAPVQDVGG